MRYFWTLQGTNGYEHLSMASGCPELVFHYRSGFHENDLNGALSFTAGLHAQTDRPRRFITQEAFGIFGAYLYPHTVPLLLGLPAQELTNEMPALPDLLKQDGRDLEEQIALAANDRQRADLLESFLLKRLCRWFTVNDPVQQLIRDLVHAATPVETRILPQRVFLSPRQFQRRFLEQAGMPASLFQRIGRFHRALEQYGRGRDLTSIAWDSGYYDQAHFNRDFKQFSGQTPGAFFGTTAESWRNA